MKHAVLVSGFFLLSVGFGVFASTPPDAINYQGVLRDSDDQPLDGAHSMIFRFFSAETGGDEILVDTHGTVTVSDGLFNVQLGSGSVTDGSGPGEYTTLSRVFANYPDLHLEVEVSGETLSPRIRVVSAGYALNTRYVRGKDLISEGPLDLYVDAAGGNDGNDGLSPTTAKQAIQAAIDAIPAVLTGDVTVRVKPGAYNERVRILARERVNDLHWIRLIADPVDDPPTVFIDGTGVPARSDGVATAGVFVSHALVEVVGIHVMNFRDPDNDNEAGFEVSVGGLAFLRNCRSTNNNLGLALFEGQAYVWDTHFNQNDETGVFLAIHGFLEVGEGTEISDNEQGGWIENGSFLAVDEAAASPTNPCVVTNNNFVVETQSTIAELDRCVITNSSCVAGGTGECSPPVP